MFYHRKFLILMLIVTLVLGAVSAQDETVLVIGHAESTDSLDPARGFTGTTQIINRVTYDTLVTFPDENADSIEPMLATDWSISDDGLTYTFNLRDDVTFWDGTSLTAADVVFSLQRLQNVKGNPSFLSDGIASVEALDDHTVAITLNAVTPSFLAEISTYVFSITNAEIIKANGGTDAADAAETDAAEAFLNSTSVGTGPYILESWEPGVETILIRNENYWGEQPYFDRVIIVNIPEAATQKIALESGDIQMALDLSRDQAEALDDVEGITVWRGPGLATHFLLMNADPDIGGIVSDPTVQLAIRYALDYEGYKVLWGGIAPGSNLAFGIGGAWGEDKNIGRDLDRARELLVEAGYPNGFDITLSYPDFGWQGVDMNINAQKIQADLAEVRINVTLNPGELGVSLDEYRNGQQAFGYWFWNPDKLDPVDFFAFLPGGKVATERANWLPENSDPAMLELIEAAASELDQETRFEMFSQLQEMAQMNSSFAPFNLPGLQTAYASNIEGYIRHPQWELDVSLLSQAQ